MNRFLALLPLGTMLGACSMHPPSGFVHLDQAVPGILIEARYAGSDNFVGAPIDGYQSGRLLLTREAAQALAAAQRSLSRHGLGLKVFDAYRPQRAVDHFVRWTADEADRRMAQRYYPNLAKSDLIPQGYIAARSGHSRGSTIDVTLIRLDSGQELDMGSPWDYFDPISWPTSDQVDDRQKANRMRLRSVMLDNGFAPLKEEWWHFTLKDEPWPQRYFDFPVR